MHEFFVEEVVELLRRAELADGQPYGVLLAVAQFADEGKLPHVRLDDVAAGAHILVQAQGAGHEAEGASWRYAVGRKAVAQRFVVGAFGQVEAQRCAVGGGAAQSEGANDAARQHGGEDDDYGQGLFFHSISCMRMVSTKWLSYSSHSLKWPHSL